MASVLPPRSTAQNIVLVVEDEPGLMFLIQEMLDQDGGFKVITARNADEAFKLLEVNSDIECVFTDVKMPGHYDGIDLTRHVLKAYPAIKVMIASGHFYAGSPVERVPFLAKPYDLIELPNALRNVLASNF